MHSENKQSHVVELLMSMFSKDELLRLLRFELEGDGDKVANELGKETRSLMNFTAGVVKALQRHEKLGDAFFSTLIQERPRWRQKIESVRDLEGPKRKAVRNLLINCFDLSGLRRFVLYDLNEEVVLDEVERSETFSAAVAALDAQGMIDRDFFEILRVERNRRVNEIDRLEQLWFGEEEPHHAVDEQLPTHVQGGLSIPPKKTL